MSLAIMTALAALLLLGGRSETIRGLRGDERDERFETFPRERLDPSSPPRIAT
jgi:hypothetical protein